MTKPTTIKEMITALEGFVVAAKDVDSSDITHEAKLAKLNELSEVYGLA